MPINPPILCILAFFFEGERSPSFLGELEGLLSVSTVSSERVSMSTSKSDSDRSPDETCLCNGNMTT